MAHPAVADVAVIPSLDEQSGEVPKVLVVRRAHVPRHELMAFVAEQVASLQDGPTARVRGGHPAVCLGQRQRHDNTDEASACFVTN
jgi:hypothetical protein